MTALLTPFTAPTLAERIRNADEDGVQQLFDKLPGWIQQALRTHLKALEEVVLDLDEPLKFRANDLCHILYTGRTVSHQDLMFITGKLGQFREDNRIGIQGTLHRVSCIRDAEGIVSLTIRFGRAVPGLAEPIRHFVQDDLNLLLLGPPGVGKTTCLRDIARLAAAPPDVLYRCVVVDTSNEIGGDSRTPHPAIGHARRMRVNDKSQQAAILLEAVKNQSAVKIIADEIGYHDDVEVLGTIATRGVRIITTAHGKTLQDVLRNRHLHPLIGEPDFEHKCLRMMPTFDVLITMPLRGVFVVYPNLALTLETFLQSGTLEGAERIELNAPMAA